MAASSEIVIKELDLYITNSESQIKDNKPTKYSSTFFSGQCTTKDTKKTCTKSEDKLNITETLDLAMPKSQYLTEEQKVGLLIHSLKENYTSYGLKVIAKHHAPGVVDSFINNSFFIVPRIPLPAMNIDSKYKVWQKFVNRVCLFFDGENRQEFISELYQLQRILALTNDEESTTQSLEKIFSDFEHISGFSSTVTIQPSDGYGNGGLLTPSQFKNILLSGHPINDLGASLHHGKLPHRLQFYILGQYFLKNVTKFFTPQDLSNLIDTLTIDYPEMLEDNDLFPIHKIISIFYRLLGADDFNDCFDWAEFLAHRTKLNLEYNKREISEHFNMADIWVQLFDRYGYAGFFSVPSSFGILQKLGCFSFLPAISVPNISEKRDLRIIMDVTPRLSL